MATISKVSVLAVDDDQPTLLYIKTLLRGRYQVFTAQTTREAEILLAKEPIDVILLDILLENGDNGLELLKKLNEQKHPADIIVISGIQMSKTIVSAMRDGAVDYITKPLKREPLHLALERTVNRRCLEDRASLLSQELGNKNGATEIITESPKMLQLKSMVSELRNQNVNVFIVGDTGTGKEKFARLVHHQERNPARPFVSINCAAIPENLLESMLFGHEKGSFTGATERRIGKFEVANGGDIFLDEISCLPLDLQAKLLRVLEEKEIERVGGSRPIKINFRVICASNDNIIDLVAAGKFRKDLFYRLNTVTLQLPSLSQRREDIIPLAEYFLATHRRTKEPKILSEEVKAILIKHHWRGNVRELKNTIENMLIFSKSDTIETSDIPFLKNNLNNEIQQKEDSSTPASKDSLNMDGTYEEVLARVERKLILDTLERNRWNKTKACREIGMKRNKLYRRMAELGIQ